MISILVAGVGYKVSLGMAQDGVATPLGNPTVPSATACTVTPIQLPLFSGTPAASFPGDAAAAWVPVPQAGDVSPSEEALRGVRGTILQSIACENAQDYLRQYALFTDRLLRELIGGAAGLDGSALLSGTPQTSQGGFKVGLVELRDAQQTEVDAIRVTVVYGSYDGARLVSRYEAQLVLVEEDGRWLIDGVALSR
jgi:hypothetical protein